MNLPTFPKHFSKMLLAALLVVILAVGCGYAYYFTNIFGEHSLRKGDNPPKLELSGEILKGSVNIESLYYVFTAQQEHDYVVPAGANPQTDAKVLVSGFNYFYSTTDVTVADVISYIQPTAGNKILIAIYSSNDTLFPAPYNIKGWLTYKKGPYEETTTIEDASRVTIPAYYGFTVLSAKNSTIWKVRDVRDSISAAEIPAATVEKLKTTNGWVLLPVKTNQSLTTFLAPLKARAQQFSTMQREGGNFNDSSFVFADADLSGGSLVWVLLGDTTCNSADEHYEFGSCRTCEVGKYFDNTTKVCSTCEEGKIANANGTACEACPAGWVVATDGKSCDSLCGDGILYEQVCEYDQPCNLVEECDFGTSHNNGNDKSNLQTGYQAFVPPAAGASKFAHTCSDECKSTFTTETTEVVAVNAECGGMNGLQGIPHNATALPSGPNAPTLCKAGSTATAPTFDNPSFYWECNSDTGGTSINCSATKMACLDPGETCNGFDSLCCDGLACNGNNDTTCGVAVTPVAGVCGEANESTGIYPSIKYLLDVWKSTIYESTFKLCDVGIPNNPNPMFPDQNTEISTVNWSCSGTDGGEADNCSATRNACLPNNSSCINNDYCCSGTCSNSGGGTGKCVVPVTAACDPAQYTNATVCAGDNTGLTGTTDVLSNLLSYQSQCTTANKCEFYCTPGYINNNNGCILSECSGANSCQEFVSIIHGATGPIITTRYGLCDTGHCCFDTDSTWNSNNGACTKAVGGMNAALYYAYWNNRTGESLTGDQLCRAKDLAHSCNMVDVNCYGEDGYKSSSLNCNSPLDIANNSCKAPTFRVKCSS